MISAREMAGSLYGIWRLITLKPDAFTYFNATPEGFWRSFTAAALLAPFQGLHQMGLYIGQENPPPGLRFALVEAVEYVILWLIYPVVMLSLSGMLERRNRFLVYIVAYNWFQLAVGAAVMPWLILTDFGVIPIPAAQFLNLVTFAAYTVYAAFIAREGLKVTVATSIGLVLVDILLTLMVEQVTVGMIYAANP